jgi:hypothetical protein
MTESVNILPRGACLLVEPLAAIRKEGKALTSNSYGQIRGIYTFGNMLQVVAILRGERDVPQEIRPLCALRANAGPRRGADTFADIDMALLEPASPIEITFRGCSLNRRLVVKLVVRPISALGPEAAKAAKRWFRVGIEGVNATVRAEAGRAAIDLLPPDFENRAFFEAVILETRSARSDMVEGFSTMREVLGRPIGVLAYVFQYLADGRAISMPSGFLKDVREAAHQLDLPMLEPAEYVNKYPAGVAAALKPDLRHYSPEFASHMGDVIVEFCRGVRDRARRPAANAPFAPS